jgi:FtsP/CotA-like multicopper oxidase with cupredoxin domain
MKASRRNFLQGGLMAATGWLSGKAFAATSQQEQMEHMHHPAKAAARAPAAPAGDLGAGVLPVETPDVPKLPWKIDGGVKVFHLVAEPVKHEFLPGQTFDLWGYNGSAPGPTIEVNQGDRVRIIVDNHLPEFTSMHWHGFEIPADMDGVPGISQEPVPPGGRFIYEFTLHQAGTFFYHSHMPMQEMIGMIGLFIMHPKEAYRPRVDKDFGIILQEYAILPNNTVPNTMSMELTGSRSTARPGRRARR